MTNARTTAESTTSTRAGNGAADTLAGQAAIVKEDLKALGHMTRETLTSTAKTAATECANHGRETGRRVGEYVRKRPVTALVVALGVGALGGLFFSRR